MENSFPFFSISILKSNKLDFRMCPHAWAQMQFVNTWTLYLTTFWTCEHWHSAEYTFLVIFPFWSPVPGNKMKHSHTFIENLLKFKAATCFLQPCANIKYSFIWFLYQFPGWQEVTCRIFVFFVLLKLTFQQELKACVSCHLSQRFWTNKVDLMHGPRSLTRCFYLFNFNFSPG